jgi:hypothetical protein
LTEYLKEVDAMSKSIRRGVPTVAVGYGRTTAPTARDPLIKRLEVIPAPELIPLGVKSLKRDTRVDIEAVDCALEPSAEGTDVVDWRFDEESIHISVFFESSSLKMDRSSLFLEISLVFDYQ